MAKIDANSVSVENKKIVIDESRQICVCCSSLIPVSTNKFFTNRSVYMNSEIFGICKDCIDKLKTEDDLEDLLRLLRFLDIPLYKDKWDSVVEKNLNKNFLIKIGRYMSQMALVKDKDYDQGDIISIRHKSMNLENTSLVEEIESSIGLSREQEKAKSDCEKILGYDPFEGYNTSDLKFLYPELVNYLDEDTQDDMYKISIIIQIITNNLQIRWCDIAINQLGSSTELFIKNSKDIKDLTATKSQLNQANDKLSKENQIALKHRGDASSKNSTLGSMMKDLRELNFEKAEVDYYTIQKAYGMKHSLDISNQSIVDIIKFDENKQNEVFKIQREMIVKFQEEELEFNEKIRLLVVENNRLKRELDETKE